MLIGNAMPLLLDVLKSWDATVRFRLAVSADGSSFDRKTLSDKMYDVVVRRNKHCVEIRFTRS